MQKNLKIRFSIPGFHYWPNPPEEYSYLGQVHRHVFYWIITIPIEKYREIEFIDLKDNIVEFLHKTTRYQNNIGQLSSHLNFGNMSCEEIAVETQQFIKEEFNIECYSVEVAEDEENSAEIIWA